jgi:hypothetical protein
MPAHGEQELLRTALIDVRGRGRIGVLSVSPSPAGTFPTLGKRSWRIDRRGE